MLWSAGQTPLPLRTPGGQRGRRLPGEHLGEPGLGGTAHDVLAALVPPGEEDGGEEEGHIGDSGLLVEGEESHLEAGDVGEEEHDAHGDHDTVVHEVVVEDAVLKDRDEAGLAVEGVEHLAQDEGGVEGGHGGLGELQLLLGAVGLAV